MNNQNNLKHTMDKNYHTLTIHFDTAQKPKFTEKKSAGYVQFGEKNDYPKYLLDLYAESPKHGGIVKNKCIYIYGKGFEQKGRANELESWNDVLRKLVKDDELYRGFYLQVIWNRERKVKDIYHLEFHKVRVSKDLSTFYVKNDWADNKEKARIYPAFNPNNPIGSQIFYYKEYNPLSEIYPLPYYYQGLNTIESDIQVSRHLLGNAKQGFSGTKLINLNNGDPLNEEHKGEVERGLLNKFTGSEGRRVVIMFNKSKDNEANIQDLGVSMLTKEDFTNVNNLIQSEIMSCHGITSPVLFGISTPGALGQRNEMRDAFEIFTKTYVNDRQQLLENIVTKFRNMQGESGEFKIQPVEPLSFQFSEQIISQNLTQNEIREIMGKEPLATTDVTADGVKALPETTEVVNTPIQQNEAIRNLSGRQYQNVMRIVRQFGNGKLTKQQASLMLKNGFGFTDADVDTFLGVDNDPLTEDEVQKFSADPDALLIQEFSNCGESRDNFEVIKSFSKCHFDTFADDSYTLSQLGANILDLINKDKRITDEVIAKTLKKSVTEVTDEISRLVDNNILKVNIEKVGLDEIRNFEVLKPASELPGKDSKVAEVLVLYSYEWRSIVPTSQRDTALHPSRQFCRTLMGLDKFYTRYAIEQISQRLGYSVWDRCGGFWNNKGKIEFQCRHEWKANIVKRKK